MNWSQIGVATKTPSAPSFIRHLGFAPRSYSQPRLRRLKSRRKAIVQSCQFCVVPVFAATSLPGKVKGEVGPNTKLLALLSVIMLISWYVVGDPKFLLDLPSNSSSVFPFLSRTFNMAVFRFWRPRWPEPQTRPRGLLSSLRILKTKDRPQSPRGLVMPKSRHLDCFVHPNQGQGFYRRMFKLPANAERMETGPCSLLLYSFQVHSFYR